MQRLAQWHCCQARSCLRSQSYTRAVAVHSAGPPHVPAHVSELPSSRFQVTAKEVTANARLRLDTYLSTLLPDASRAKIQASIKSGLIIVNGKPQTKPSTVLRRGDEIYCALLPPEPSSAIPEDIPLDVVYEDRHVIIVNKAAGMVVHISPGHTSGTLVNALLFHCGLPAMDVPSGSLQGGGLLGSSRDDDDISDDGDDCFDDEDGDDEDDGVDAGAAVEQGDNISSTNSMQAPGTPASPANISSARSAYMSASSSSSSSSSDQQPSSAWPSASYASTAAPGVLRPGIVHRLDKGTTGLMVVAKDDLSHMRLCEQFKARTVSRIYHSVTLGCPASTSGRVETNIVRDPANRLRMTTAAYGSGRGRMAASNYRVLERFAGCGAALVEWKLDTGRTHQIRVHAKHIGHPLLGDDTYGPGNAASAKLIGGKRSDRQQMAKTALNKVARPSLHALTLGFDHPVTGERLQFCSQLPADFEQLLHELQSMD
eukprot:jgi/Chrzof1/1525/Cz10g11050.t1